MNHFHAACSDYSFVSLPQRLIEALGRLQAQSSSTILGSIYVYDLLEQCTLGASCSVATMLGYSVDAMHAMGAIGLANLIHSDDLALVSKHYQRFTTLKAGEVIAIEYRMKQPNGSWCWLRSQETPLVMAIDGFPLQILGIVQIIPEPRMAHTRRLLGPSKLLRRRKRSPRKPVPAKPR